RVEERRRFDDDHIRPSALLDLACSEPSGEGAEGQLRENAAQEPSIWADIAPDAHNTHAVQLFLPPFAPSILRRHNPCGIVGEGRENRDLMTTPRQPDGHLADPRLRRANLRRVIGCYEEDTRHYYSLPCPSLTTTHMQTQCNRSRAFSRPFGSPHGVWRPGRATASCVAMTQYVGPRHPRRRDCVALPWEAPLRARR